MKTLPKKPFGTRRFVSVGLFFTLVSLVITGILIQIFEAFENETPMHVSTAIHVFSGLVFTVLSILHIVINWQSLKIYIKKASGTSISKETIVALFVVIAIIAIGFLII